MIGRTPGLEQVGPTGLVRASAQAELSPQELDPFDPVEVRSSNSCQKERPREAVSVCACQGGGEPLQGELQGRVIGI